MIHFKRMQGSHHCKIRNKKIGKHLGKSYSQTVAVQTPTFCHRNSLMTAFSAPFTNTSRYFAIETDQKIKFLNMTLTNF